MRPVIVSIDAFFTLQPVDDDIGDRREDRFDEGFAHPLVQHQCRREKRCAQRGQTGEHNRVQPLADDRRAYSAGPEPASLRQYFHFGKDERVAELPGEIAKERSDENPGRGAEDSFICRLAGPALRRRKELHNPDEKHQNKIADKTQPDNAPRHAVAVNLGEDVADDVA